jgi:SM-20-related protein
LENQAHPHFEQLIDSYLLEQVGICEHFLSDALTIKLRDHLLNLHKSQQMKFAGTGNDTTSHYDSATRGDQIFWLDKAHNHILENLFFNEIDAFVLHLNSTCYAGISDYEFHFALYGPNRGYKRHLDQFKNDKSRAFSMIIYLNMDWKPENGGQLSIFCADNQTKTIAPEGGRCVFFKSDQLEHEVLLTHTNRLSITGWLKKEK